MSLSTEMNRRANRNLHRPLSGLRSDNKSRPEYVLVETEITDLVHAESRIDALRSLILLFLREIDSLKRVVGPKPRKKGDPISLDVEVDAFEATLIRDALVKCKGNQRDAAKLLKVKPTTLSAKIKRLRIKVETAITCVD